MIEISQGVQVASVQLIELILVEIQLSLHVGVGEKRPPADTKVIEIVRRVVELRRNAGLPLSASRACAPLAHRLAHRLRAGATSLPSATGLAGAASLPPVGRPAPPLPPAPPPAWSPYDHVAPTHIAKAAAVASVKNRDMFFLLRTKSCPFLRAVDVQRRRMQ